MIWSQMIAKGELKNIGNGIWSGETLRVPVIEIGKHSIQNVRVARCLFNHMDIGKEMELLVCSAHIYGVKVNGKTYKEGAVRQLGWAFLVTVALGWAIIPLVISFIFIRRFIAINSF